MDKFFQNWTVQNTIVLLLTAGFVLLVCRLARREFWKRAFSSVFSRWSIRVCFGILCLYVFVAALDSVGWDDPVRLPDGKYQLDASGKKVYAKGGSLLDRLLKPLSSKKEKGYSAPFAERQYTFVTEQSEKDGSLHRVQPSLTYPHQHILGTDIIGEDVFVQALKSIRTGLIIGLLNTLLAIPFAIFFGLCAGYYGGWIDDVVQYLCSVLSSIPSILLIAAVMVIAGRGLPQLCFAMGIASWTGLCRLLRGETLRLREADYVQAAVSLGVSSRRIILRHILPNVLHLVLISTILRFSGEVLAEAALTYLGIGVGAETMSWGTMINDARTELTRSPMIWWKLTGAFVFMLGLVLPANLFGDAVRDALDPRLRK